MTDSAHVWERIPEMPLLERCKNCGWGWKVGMNNDFPCPALLPRTAGFEVIIPGPSPKLNATYKIVDFGRRCHVCGRGPKSGLKKEEGVETWQTELAYRVRAAKPKGFDSTKVRVSIWWTNPRAADGDAGVKAALDAVASGLGIDDRDFLHRVEGNTVDRVNPHTRLLIETYE